MVFNLDSSVSTDDLHRIFGAYGEVKEVSSISMPDVFCTVSWTFPCSLHMVLLLDRLCLMFFFEHVLLLDGYGVIN